MVGCGKSQHEEQWRAHGPTSESDVGVVVKLSDPTNKQQLEDFLGENKSAQIRVVNGAQGLYEVFHMSKNEIQTSLPGAKPLFKNIYRRDLIPRPPSFHTEAVDISKCKRSPQAPSALIDVTKNEAKVQTGILEQADGEVSFTSVRSKSNNLVAPKVDVLWLISGPAGSAYESMTIDKPEISITPDLPGGYSIILVAQDGASLCGAARVEFGMTYNEPFHGAVAPRAFDESKDPSVFFHLDEIKARDAWKKGANGSGVKIAILDTGVDYNHPDLAANIYVNPKEIPGNGIDDDGNSFVDDTNGWDFFMNDAFPVDDNMHGTHVAGLAASAVTGIANHAIIMPVKVMGATGGGDLASILGGILYAADMQADFANMSLGVDSFGMTPDEKKEIQGYFTQAIQYAKAKGMMIVSAAGNGDPFTGAGFDIDKFPSYPASITDTNTVGVASVDSVGELAPYSNFGGNSVLVAAPGGTEEKPVVATYYQHKLGNYIGLTGTSMATPVVAGALAAVKSSKPGMTNEQALAYLMKTSHAVANLKGKVKSGGEIDVLAAVQAAQVAPNVLNLWGLLN
jgi:subtilisin family serine protease